MYEESLGAGEADALDDTAESRVAAQTLPSRIYCDVNHPAVTYFISSVQPFQTFFCLTKAAMDERDIIG
jgi:hypothetical protein